MNIEELMGEIEGALFTQSKGALKTEFDNVYICDLLSWVMSHAQKGDAWITVLTNVNVPAVALMAEVACVIIPEGVVPEELTVKRANENGVVMVGTGLNSFEISKRIIASGSLNRRL